MAAAATLRELADDQLIDQIGELKQELFNLRFQFATGQLENPARMSQVKRDIARINTVLREREIAAAEAATVAPVAMAAPARVERRLDPVATGGDLVRPRLVGVESGATASVVAASPRLWPII